jgi:hypothetical protein
MTSLQATIFMRTTSSKIPFETDRTSSAQCHQGRTWWNGAATMTAQGFDIEMTTTTDDRSAKHRGVRQQALTSTHIFAHLASLHE